MGSTLGNNIKLSLFGESHGQAIGVVIDGLAPGIKIDEEFIKHQLSLRSSNNILSTPRKEEDEFKIISGLYQGFTTGTPLTIIIENKDVKSKDYDLKGFRPGHADYTGFIKYNGYNDPRGGAHFSGRLTAPLVAAGAIFLSILKNKKIIIGSHLYSVGSIKDSIVNDLNKLEEFNNTFIPLNDPTLSEQITNLIEKIRIEEDSIGGVIETFVNNLPAGIGEPFFNSIESIISHALFAIPGVKGVSFGDGFEITNLKGSEANDPFHFKDKVMTITNHNGGINGGISNGMPIIIKTAFKPTPSIAKAQQTINQFNEELTLNIKGRHDPVIFLRGRVVVDSLVAFSILDLLIARYGYNWMV